MYINYRLALTFRWTFGQMRHMKGSRNKQKPVTSCISKLGGSWDVQAAEDWS